MEYIKHGFICFVKLTNNNNKTKHKIVLEIKHRNISIFIHIFKASLKVPTFNFLQLLTFYQELD